ncbi:MAG: DUF5301 domain-containing protein, partial [Oscillospiraceae bacterium]
IIFVLIARLLLKKAPKIFSYALWSIVVFRLLCPFSFESVLSLLPMGKTPIPQDIIYSTLPQINTGINIVDNSINPILPAPNMGDSANPLQIWIFIGTIIWVLGMLAMVIYSVISFAKLKKSLVGSVQMKENIYLADHISSPFVMGLIKPKIYLPSALSGSEKDFIITHEMCHIKRFDHITRILGFVALAIHWFNPLVWIAFILSGKDMEMSCDEAVMKKMNVDIRAEYSQSLLRFATGKKMLHATPLAFGEGDTKGRVKNVLNYKKPAFWVMAVSVIAIVAVGVGLAANPKNNPIFIPKSDEIVSIRIEQINEGASLGAVEVVDKSEIETILKALQNTNKTRKESVNDSPNRSDYFQININGSASRKIYLYNDKEQYFIEEPYTGIYKTSRETSLSIATIYTQLLITKETATQFVNQTLSTFKLNSDNTISFNLPRVIPTDEGGKTKLYISSSATFSPEPGTSSVQEILDMKEGWQGGESYTEKLDATRGKLTQLFLRVAFMTAEGENSYREYAANYVEFTQPFKFDTPVTVTNKSIEIDQTERYAVLKYTMQNGDIFSFKLELPKGLALATSENYPQYAQTSDMDFSAVVLVKDTKAIGSLTVESFGTDDKDVLKQVDTSKNVLPMAIFSPIAMSNHAGFENYKVIKSSATGANATAKYLWQDLTDYGGRASEAPWLKADSILAYDYEKMPFVINVNLTDGSLSTGEIEDLAKSIVIMAANG